MERVPKQAPERRVPCSRAHERISAPSKTLGRHNEFIDVALARRLVEPFERLLEHVAGSATTTQRIARAAVPYFISTDDAEDDFELAGLDDDKAVLDAVLKHLCSTGRNAARRWVHSDDSNRSAPRHRRG